MNSKKQFNSLSEMLEDPEFRSEFINKFKLGLNLRSICRALGFPVIKMQEIFEQADKNEVKDPVKAKFIAECHLARLLHLEEELIVKAFDDAQGDVFKTIKFLEKVLPEEYGGKTYVVNENHEFSHADAGNGYSDEYIADKLQEALAKVNNFQPAGR